MITPHPWQQPAVERSLQILDQCPLLINTSETGTGKTIIALETMKRLNRQFLVIAPKAVHTAWRRTAEAMSVGSQLFGVVNPERLIYKNDYYQKQKWVIPHDITVIIDEAHRGLSGPKSQTSQIVANLIPAGNEVIAMSATIADSPLKLRALGYLAGLHDFTPASFYSWCRQHGCYKLSGIPGLHFAKGAAAQRHMQNINKYLDHLMVRLRIQDIPDFPESLVVANLYDLETEYTEEINEIYEEMEAKLKAPGTNELTIQLRARQRTEALKVPLLKDLVQEALDEDHSAVVFVNFRDTLFQLQERLKEYNPGMIYGMQKDEERQQAIDQFQANDTHVMLAMIQAGGVGISLHDTNGRPRRSFITPNFSAVEFVQALGRCHRTGGSKVIQTLVLAAKTIETRIHNNIQRKLKNLSALNDGDLI